MGAVIQSSKDKVYYEKYLDHIRRRLNLIRQRGKDAEASTGISNKDLSEEASVLKDYLRIEMICIEELRKLKDKQQSLLPASFADDQLEQLNVIQHVTPTSE